MPMAIFQVWLHLWTLKLEFHRILMCYKILFFLIVPKHLEMQKQQQQQQNLKKKPNIHSSCSVYKQAAGKIWPGAIDA